MEKAYNIGNIKFTADHMIITVNGKTFKLLLSEVSNKLAKASEQEKRDFKISPSGYGIQWKLLDEDLSVNGLLKLAKSEKLLRSV
jgi:hypothetical protein